MTERSYSDACGAALALDIVGERWALLVVRELMFGPKRFTDLREGLVGISQNVLSQRLRDLEEAGVLKHTELGPPVRAKVYELTPRGRDLEPTIIALSRWGASIEPHAGAQRSVSSFALLLKALYVPARLGGRTLSVRLVMNGESFEVVASDHIDVARSRGIAVDVELRATVQAYWELIFSTPTVGDFLESGDLSLEGSTEAAELFFTLFAGPDQANAQP
ncbi:helix-turn-helix transcriptional regulator [Microbispora sp. NEAU-D428]|uniref:winged helix-turn-helix transcriptional regulator n=1 Tax=Microbispora sitophila TaxID=2771537 RepID=UPI001866EC64|nr:helix-turn-helix domain-containing protein [Microbispora sitophila]MBE3015114.1 helix-turn-helix transcriptional regulator [Microbispora sitophila]